MKLILLAVTFLLPYSGLAAKSAVIPPAPTKLKTSEAGDVRFLAVGKPSMLKIHGKGKILAADFQLEKESLKGSAEVDLNSIDTGIALRNQHMKEKYLET